MKNNTILTFRLSTLRRLSLTSAIALAVFLGGVGPAAADAFGGTSAKDAAAQASALTTRLDRIERDLQTLRQPIAAPVVVAPRTTKLPGTDLVAELPLELDYVVIGNFDGLHMVRQNEKRFFLTDSELKKFVSIEEGKAKKRRHQPQEILPVNTMGLAMMPPPPIGPSAPGGASGVSGVSGASSSAGVNGAMASNGPPIPPMNNSLAKK